MRVGKTVILSVIGGAAMAAAIFGGLAISRQGSGSLAGPSASWRAIAELPDWSGVWVLTDESAQLATQDSFGTDGGRVPLTSKYMKLRAEARAAKAQNNMSKCLPGGTPGILQHGVMHEYLFTPGRVTMLFEDGEVRRIHTDGRKHRPLDDMTGSYMGDSVGHWEDNVLVVDTIGFPNGSLFQNYGLLATINSHLVERIYMNKAGEMQIDSTFTDPAIFARPFNFSRKYMRSVLPLEEPVCQAGNRDTGEYVDLTPPPEEE